MAELYTDSVKYYFTLSPLYILTSLSSSLHVRLTAEGRGAATVYRDWGTGKITTKEEFAEARKDARTKEREAKAKERAERVRRLLAILHVLHVLWKAVILIPFEVHAISICPT